MLRPRPSARRRFVWSAVARAWARAAGQSTFVLGARNKKPLNDTMSSQRHQISQILGLGHH